MSTDTYRLRYEFSGRNVPDCISCTIRRRSSTWAYSVRTFSDSSPYLEGRPCTLARHALTHRALTSHVLAISFVDIGLSTSRYLIWSALVIAGFNPYNSDRTVNRVCDGPLPACLSEFVDPPDRLSFFFCVSMLFTLFCLAGLQRRRARASGSGPTQCHSNERRGRGVFLVANYC